MAPLMKEANLEDKKENEFFLAITDTLRIKGLWLSNYLWCRVLHIAYTLCHRWQQTRRDLQNQQQICKNNATRVCKVNKSRFP